MAAFSTMALLGAGALAGGALGGMLGSRRKKADPNAPLAPGPTDNLAPPQPPIVDPGEANAQALGAAAKQRKRTARGGLLAAPIAAPSNNTMPARYTARTLLGS